MGRRRHRNAVDGNIPTSRDFDPSAIRAALGKALLNAIAADFTRNAAARINTLIAKRPLDYLRLVVALLPKEFRLKQVELPHMTDEELAGMISAVRAAIAEKEKEQAGEAEPAGQEPGGA